jgi:predicted ATPase/DNA-binding SARP family transcriptional activator
MVLGPLEVRADDGEPCPVRRGRPRTLLHLLLLHRRIVLPVDVLADRLWDEELPQDAANGLHQLVSSLRRALGPDGKERLVTTSVGYRLDAADDEVDAWHFDRLAQRALHDLRAGSAAAAQQALITADEAARLWRGDPYPESAAHEWAHGDINRMKESWLQLQETRMEALLRLGRHREVVLEAQSLAAAHPLRERFHAQRALALYRSDRQGEALDVLRAVRRTLADELGLDPGRALQSLEQQILRRDPALAAPPAGTGAAAPARPEPPDGGTAGPRDPDSFPAPGQPPRPPALVGRDDALALATARLEPGATVTLTGPAGIGKTALARTIARSIARTEHGGTTWYVDLADVDAAELAAAAMARQLGYSGQLPGDPTSVLVAGFRSRRGLLVVDTCEHLLPAVALALHAVREQAPDLTILATSRRPLGVPDETVVRLPPLALPPEGAQLSVDELAAIPAVQLFLQRATRVRSDFRLDASSAGDVAEIVRAVEGLPLGLEVAAANAEALDAAGIRQRLDHHLDAGPAPSPFVARRQSSLGAALEVSCALLTDAERQVLGPLSVFRGAFDLPAVTAVVAPEAGDPYPTLASLVRQSMVSHESGQSYRMLRPIRDYVGEKAATEPGHGEIRDRHAAYVARAATTAGRELRTSTTALDRLHALLADGRAAMEWSLTRGRLGDAADIAVAYTWYWAINGLAEEGLQWLRTVLAAMDEQRAVGAADVLREAAVLRSLGLLSNPLGDVAAAGAYCRRSIELSRSIHDEVGTTAALLTLGIAEWARGDFAAAAAAHDEAMSTAARTGERWHALAALTLRARTALDAGEDDAVERTRSAIAAAQQAGEWQMLSIALSLLARHHLGTGLVEEAAVAAAGALEQARRIHYREGEMGALNLLGRVRLQQAALDAAVGCFDEALRTAADIQHRGGLCEAVESLALAAVAAGRHEHAALLLQVVERERSRLGLRAPAFGADAVAEATRVAAEALGPARSLVEARSMVTTFDGLVAELLQRAHAQSSSTVP